MSHNQSITFQADSQIVNNSYHNSKNYLIENDELNSEEKWCAIYFSSNDIYYPNDEVTFVKEIVTKNKFEWFGTRVKKASKHIFLRDIKKQWYLTGINSEINTPEKLADFLLRETKDYKIITIGSSAGGFAAVLMGQLLEAKQIYSFNGQFEVNSLLFSSDQNKNPIVFRNQNNSKLNQYYNTKGFIKNPSTILYFTSLKSQIDVKQMNFVADLPINIFGFNTSHHGIPFIKSVLPKLINMEMTDLLNKKRPNLNPVFFSIRIAGVTTTTKGIIKSIKKVIKRKLV